MVKVTRTEASQGREFTDISTLLDLRKANKDEWKQIVFHRYGMMEQETAWKLLQQTTPKKYMGFLCKNLKVNIPGFTKTGTKRSCSAYYQKVKSGLGDDGFSVVNEYDLRPLRRHSATKCFMKLLPK